MKLSRRGVIRDLGQGVFDLWQGVFRPDPRGELGRFRILTNITNVIVKGFVQRNCCNFTVHLLILSAFIYLEYFSFYALPFLPSPSGTHSAQAGTTRSPLPQFWSRLPLSQPPTQSQRTPIINVPQQKQTRQYSFCLRPRQPSLRSHTFARRPA